MFADLYNTITINLRLAQTTDLEVAVYWSELMFISERVVYKNTFDTEGYFKLDRDYVERQTTLSIDAQSRCDRILSELGVLEVQGDRVRVDAEKMTGLIASVGDSKTYLSSIKNRVKMRTAAEEKARKQEIMANRCKKSVSEFDPDIRSRYYDLIDSLVGDRKMTAGIVKSIQRTIDSYTDTKDIKLQLLDMLIQSHGTDASRAIHDYERYRVDMKTSRVEEEKRLDTERRF